MTDAIGGVTLSLQQAEVNTTVNVSVARNTGAALTAVKNFASAYNAITSFVKTNTATGGALAYNAALKSSARAFTNTLLTDVAGVTLSRSALVGISLDKNGALGVDDNAFTDALRANPDAVKSLFALAGSVTGSGLEYVSAGDATVAGTYAVNITAAATRATATGSGSVFPYVAGATPTHLTVLDSGSGITDSITLANGDGASALSVRLNAMFTARHMLLTATVVGGELSITSGQYGSKAGFNLIYDAGDTTSASALGLAAGPYNGIDVAGTIGGVAGTGAGQTLTGAAGDVTAGLLLRYTGSATGAIGNTTLTTGLGAQMSRLATLVSRDGDGTAATSQSALAISIARAEAHGADVAERLDRRKASLLKQFAAMEAAIQRITAQGNSITASLNALTALQSTK
ncbi:MAG: flagellar filament capping protein FliD [bacterium]